MYFIFLWWVDEVEAFVNSPMSPHKMLSDLYQKCPKCLWSSTLVSQPVQHVSGFLVLVEMFLVPNGTSCLIKKKFERLLKENVSPGVEM